VTAVTPWSAADIDPDRVIAELRRRFPCALAWWGKHTGSWWAICQDRTGRHRLIEATDPAALGRRLEALGARARLALARPVIETGTARRLWQPPPGDPPGRALPRPPGATSRRGWWRRLFRR